MKLGDEENEYFVLSSLKNNQTIFLPKKNINKDKVKKILPKAPSSFIYKLFRKNDVKVNKKQLLHQLQINSMLRYILNDPRRQVTLQIKSKKHGMQETILSSSQFAFSPDKKLGDENFNFIYEGLSLPVKISFYKNHKVFLI